MDSAGSKTDVNKSYRRSKKIKNLEEEVEFILSQDESDDNIPSEGIEELLPKTPSRTDKAKEIYTPRASQAVLQETLQTPRRSCRKSIKPTQDYEDIVNKSCTRLNRSVKKELMTTEEEEQNDTENVEDPTAAQPKWTPAKVGRVSQKRGRKSRRNTKVKQTKGKKENDKVTEELNENIKEHKDKLENSINMEESHEKEKNLHMLKDTNKEKDMLKDIKKTYNHCVETVEILQEAVEIKDMYISDKDAKKSYDSCKETTDKLHASFKTGENFDVLKQEEERGSTLMKTDKGRNILNEIEKLNKCTETKKIQESVEINHLNVFDQDDKSSNGSQETTDILQKSFINGKKFGDLKQDIAKSSGSSQILGNEIENENINPTESLTEFINWEEKINNIQDNDEPIHLIQEDSEDGKQLPLKCEDRDDFSKTNKTDHLPKLETSEKLFDSFGCYLKSKEINISDLGLNPLKDDDPEDDTKEKIKKEIDLTDASPDSEEMPSLIVCEDDEEDTKKSNGTFNANESVVVIEEHCTSSVKPSEKQVNGLSDGLDTEESKKLNDTFEATDSVVLMEDICKSSSKSSQEIMESLQLSDDEGEAPKKAPPILINTELQNQTLHSSLKLPCTERQQTTPKLPSTPRQLATPKLPSTPKQSTKAFRFPTPYRNRQNFKFNKEGQQSVEKNLVKNPLTTLEPKDIVLRGIRKRSISMCIDGNDEKRQRTLANSKAKLKQERIVSFHSPANQTTIIDDLDLIIAKSLKKQKRLNKDVSNEFVTTRRKRSLSMDESLMSTASMASRLPRPIPSQNTPNKTQASSSKPLARTKLPNFAAMHQKQFEKMENLVDHVNRKQERSKILINSATKIRPASTQKNILIKNANTNQIEKPKALKKIDLGVSQINKSSNITLNTTISTTSATNVKNRENLIKTRNLPDPFLGGLTKNIKTGVIPQKIQRLANESQENVTKRKLPHPQKTGLTPQKVAHQAAPSQQPHIRKYLKPTQPTIHNTTTTRLNNSTLSTSTIIKPKPNFNLSTSIIKPSSSTSTSMENLNKISNEDKMASRLQRHMDLFKGRVPATRAGVASRKNDAVIRGVRSNRRFELQMQHRKNMEN